MQVGEQNKWGFLQNKKPGSDTKPGSGENVRPLVILAYGVNMSLLHNIRLLKERVARDLGANVQCARATVVPLPHS
jgi:hypothetical protein